jgi:hypothetical protein
VTTDLDAPEWDADCRQWHGRVLDGRFGHYCHAWDGLPLDESCYELNFCECKWQAEMGPKPVVAEPVREGGGQ